jgi:predicted RNA-binding Zn ribbon-like protein
MVIMDAERTVTLALDFANMGRGREPDACVTPSALTSWLDEHVPGDSAAPAPLPVQRHLLGEAVRLRSAIDALLDAASAERAPPPLALDALQRVLAAGTWRRRVVVEDRIIALREWPIPSGDPLARLAPVASAAAALIETTSPDRIRRCAAGDCRRWFVDTSRGGQRRWCSMATCGNRAKAARWRIRHADD